MKRMVPEQLDLSRELPIVIGSVDYQEFTWRLTRLYPFEGKTIEFPRFLIKGLPHICFSGLRFEVAVDQVVSSRVDAIAGEYLSPAACNAAKSDFDCRWSADAHQSSEWL